MIEMGTSRSQHAIAKWQGRLLCSSVDPVQEAQKWVDRQAGRIRGLKQVLVLGAGCGYHLAALQKAFPEQKILVVEAQYALIDLARRENGLELSDVQFLHVSDRETFLKNTKIQRFVRGEYAILKFAPCLITAQSFYDQAEELLLGRGEAGFKFILAQRPELNDLFQAERVLKEEGLISIKTIEAALQPNTDFTAGLLVRALRELVN